MAPDSSVHDSTEPPYSPVQKKTNSGDPESKESNHNLPARTVAIAEDERPEQTKEDPATMAASEELKHTTLSDKIATGGRVQEGETAVGEDKVMEETLMASTPEPEDAHDEDMRERITSPKKKRGRDQDEDAKNVEDDTEEPGSSADGSVVGGRTSRSEPEKKRPRDNSEEASKTTDSAADLLITSAPAKSEDTTISAAKSPTTTSTDKPKTSTSAFASSGFASLAASASSPFGSLTTKPSIFSSGTQTSSGFGGLASAKSPSTTTPSAGGFGGLASADKPTTGFGFGSGASSGFGGLASGSVFGAQAGNGFGGGAGSKLSSFAAPAKEVAPLGAKPAKAFGAPESDEDDGSDEDDSETGAGTDDEESAAAMPEEKKKSKLTKVRLDDGEAGEATLLQLRTKLFALESKEVGWKERGVGTLKINVPKSCVSYDEYGTVIPGSFDISGLEEEDPESTGPRVARLIMRQENTHRVVLNTIIVRAMEFKDKPATSTAQIIFTAFEGEGEPKPVNMLLKMSEANAKLFRREIESVQHEL